jgi:RNA polymerase sigma-70 factor (ECF subfamily)
MEQQEIDLIKGAQSGDTLAFDKLVCLHDRWVLQMAYSMLSNRQDAQDIYQEALLKAFTRISSFRFESEFRTWLGRIVINLSINRRRQRRVKRWLSRSTATDVDPDRSQPDEYADIPSESETDRLTLSRELVQHIDRALGTLPDLQRAVFVLKHLHGYKISEISVMLNRAEGTVKNSLFRATKKLQEMLKPFH